MCSLMSAMGNITAFFHYKNIFVDSESSTTFEWAKYSSTD